MSNQHQGGFGIAHPQQKVGPLLLAFDSVTSNIDEDRSSSSNIRPVGEIFDFDITKRDTWPKNPLPMNGKDRNGVYFMDKLTRNDYKVVDKFYIVLNNNQGGNENNNQGDYENNNSREIS